MAEGNGNSVPLSDEWPKEGPSCLCSSNHSSLLFLYSNSHGGVLSVAFGSQSSHKDPTVPLIRGISEICMSNGPSDGNVDRICLSYDGSQLALIGDRFLSIVDIPSKLSVKNGMRALAKSYVAECHNFDDFLRDEETQIVKAVWYPNDPFIGVLSSDSVYSVFDCKKSKEAIIMKLSIVPDNPIRRSLGEFPVSFDLDSESRVYFVLQTGDVIQASRDLTDSESIKVQPTLSDEIYAEEFQDIAILDNDRNADERLIVLATNRGTLLNGILLEDDDEQECVFVFEQLQIFEPSNTETSPALTIVKDPMSSRKYFVNHSRGIHSVLIEWSAADGSVRGGENRHSYAQYLLSTKPSTSMNSVTILPSNAPHSTYSLLSVNPQDGALFFTALSVAKSRKRMFSNEHEETSVSKPNHDGAATSSVDNDEFIDKIKGILKKDITAPHISSWKSEDEEVLSRRVVEYIGIYRKEYIERIRKAKQTAHARMESLSRLLQSEETERQDLLARYKTLNGQHEGLAGRIGQMNERQEQLAYRLMTVHRTISLQEGRVDLSSAELEHFNQLRAMMNSAQSAMDRIKSIKSVMGDDKVGSTPPVHRQQNFAIGRKPSMPTVGRLSSSGTQMLALRKLLDKQNADLNELTAKFEQVKDIVCN